MTEAQARQLITDQLLLFARYADMTPTEIDNRTVAMAQLAVANDIVWGWLWKFVQRWLEEDEMIVGDCPEPAEAAEVGIDPLTIIAIIKAVVELIKLFRKYPARDLRREAGTMDWRQSACLSHKSCCCSSRSVRALRHFCSPVNQRST